MSPAAVEGGIAAEFREVRKSFRARRGATAALEGATFRVRAGTLTGLVGPDGAGKTTALRLLAGLLAPDSGSVSLLGFELPRAGLEVQRRIGYLPQRFGLYEELRVGENLDLYADLQGVPRAERPARYAGLLAMTGLAPFVGRLARHLSGGMKQKLGLACALVGRPPVLLLDEPTVGVDAVSRRELWVILDRLVREDGATVLVTTAYLDEAERCRDVVLLHRGRVLDQGPPGEFAGACDCRAWRVTVPGLSRRDLQERVAAVPGVVDAMIEGGAVRCVLRGRAGGDGGLSALAAGGDVRPVALRFEDAFVARLKDEAAAPPARPPGPAARPGPAAATGGPVIEVDRAERRFGGFRAVKGISFSVRRGEVFGLLGANGAGKSTTFRMLCGLLPASGGTLRVAGRDLRRAAGEARARIGYMAQRFSLYADLSPAENLRFFGGAYGLRDPARRAAIDRALDEFGLRAVAATRSGDLPAGFKQRLALAAALLHEPEILFLDEPTSGVDPLARREFWTRINHLAHGGVTVLVTTHFMVEAEYCDRLVLMDQGEILAEGTPAEMKARVRTAGRPDPTMEEAFLEILAARRRAEAAA